MVANALQPRKAHHLCIQCEINRIEEDQLVEDMDKEMQDIQMDLDTVLEASDCDSPIEVYKVSRVLNGLPRCQTLPYGHTSVASHTLSCMYLLDFLHTNGYMQTMTEEDMRGLRLVLQYHDIQEGVTGDIPSYVSKCLPKDISHGVYSNILNHMVSRVSISKMNRVLENKYLYKIYKSIDMLEFIVTMAEKSDFGNLYNSSKVRKVISNAKSLLDKGNVDNGLGIGSIDTNRFFRDLGIYEFVYPPNL